jgi:cytochrome oxidase Cu insertion factor (SCO1/SenC/PrrC family)
MSLHPIERMQAFFASWRFPALVLSVLVTFKVLLLLVLLVPPPAGLEAFAEELEVWCFGYDPATGKLQPAYVLVTMAEPLVLGAVILGIWWRPLAEIVRGRPRALVPYFAAAALIVAGASASLFGFKKEARADELPFPAKSLRTSLPTPPITLTNQDGARFSVEEQRGKVVLLTGVYATCGYTCPMLMSQAKRAIAALTEPERRDVVVAAVTLDPARDGQLELTKMAEGQHVAAPTWNLLWGPPAEVERALDDLAIARKRDPETGVIDHANLLLLVDRKGELAYRLTLGAEQERWLVQALRTLLAERGAER